MDEEELKAKKETLEKELDDDSLTMFVKWADTCERAIRVIESFLTGLHYSGNMLDRDKRFIDEELLEEEIGQIKHKLDNISQKALAIMSLRSEIERE